MKDHAAPRPSLNLIDAIAIIIGIVIGAGIFETPALVAANASSSSMVLLFWLAGGVISLIGALCYAELATTYPHVGGSYHYLKKAFGHQAAFLYAWARMAVVQTGSIALLAFVFGDYAAQIWSLGPMSSAIYAASVILLFTGLNIIGLKQGKRTQNLLSAAQIVGLGVLIIVGITSASALPHHPVHAVNRQGSLGLAMVFVLLSYGGWNEAAFISAEIKNRNRNIVRSLIWSIGIITVTYLLVNWALLQGLGLATMAKSEAVAATLMRQTLGDKGAVFISLLVAICALGSINASILTGARTNFALGQDFPVFRFMNHWQAVSSAPIIAYILQGSIALVLVAFGSLARGGFKAMVDYTAPVFWFFFMLSGLSLIILRHREPDVIRPFRVPLYPLTPLIFCGASAYLLYSSLVYTGIGAMVGVVVVALGVPFLFLGEGVSSKKPLARS
ncbi:MAG TPA: amino acid permease [Oligoflexus sp.]|uniref:APC family permease n=1 Tax=Oligoflexus sp. TaxID=1971216 RepID=UPI002D6F4D5E|nr:amino acid permease [Oligoflexus sp.]HYX39340.1 amino acid permease [Oligoflexus sp.]